MGTSLRAGDVVADKYRIERQIGVGGMGVVVAATHLQLNQPVALKFLVDGSLDPRVAAERFLREARATFRLRSEHTVRVLDVGSLPTGEPYMVMELLVGKDFKEILHERGALPPAEAALYVVQACAALQEAHAFGIVHRDFKARNVFVTTRIDGSPCVKVLDFGISKMDAGADVAPLTLPDMGMGSPRYMAPEQWTSAATVDARADIYAAGAVLYELITGEIPLAGLPLVEVIKRVRAGAVPSPKELRPELPEELCRVVMKALRPRPEERYASAAEFAEAIREAVPDAVADTGLHPRKKPVIAATLPTAIVQRDILLARAEAEARLSEPTPQSGVPTKDERPPAALLPVLPAPTSRVPSTQAMSTGEFEDVATVVTQSPYALAGDEDEVAPQHATLQVAEVPPEIAAMRHMYIAKHKAPEPSEAYAPPPSFATAGPAMAPPPIPIGVHAHPMRGRRMPAWLFWMLFLVFFGVAGGAVAAVLTRVVQ